MPLPTACMPVQKRPFWPPAPFPPPFSTSWRPLERARRKRAQSRSLGGARPQEHSSTQRSAPIGQPESMTSAPALGPSMMSAPAEVRMYRTWLDVFLDSIENGSCAWTLFVFSSFLCTFTKVLWLVTTRTDSTGLHGSGCLDEIKRVNCICKMIPY